MKAHPVIYCAVLFSVLAQAQSYAPKDGFVPDPKTAVKIAEAVLIPVYGEKQIESEQPFKAVLENGVWTVDGTLRCSDGKGDVTTMCDGGTAEAKRSKIGRDPALGAKEHLSEACAALESEPVQNSALRKKLKE